MKLKHFKEMRLLALLGMGITQFSASLQAIDPPTPIPSGVVVLSQKPANGAPDPALAANFPDKFAWTLFLSVIKAADKQVKVGPGNALTTNNALWETWPDDPYTFPPTGQIDPKNPPKWPTGAVDDKPNTKRIEKGFSAHARKTLKSAMNKTAANVGADVPDSGGEEVRRNKATFDYIIKNNLWYQEGAQAFYKKAANSKSLTEFTQNNVNLPIEAVEVKGNWIPIQENQKSQYHWNYNEDGQLLGLVAMHISSKALPNWFWCTFEWTGNPGRGDYIGIHDSFGLKQAHTPSNTDVLNKVYPAGDLTDELLALFKTSGITGDWAKEWQNYRLKGSQIDFTDAAGRPLLLGNSVTEAGFMTTASCITCHARAAVTSKGSKAFPIFGEKTALPLVSIPQQGALTTQNPTFITYNGAPDPTWFFSFDGNTSAMGSGTTLVNLQTDFVWAIPMRANPMKKPAGQ